MIPEAGHFALIIAFCFSIAQIILPSVGVAIKSQPLMSSSKAMAAGLFFFTLISFIALTFAFIQDDFSVLYVSQNSTIALPFFYKISAVWGAHEGSLLLWVLIMSVWSLLVALYSRHLPSDIIALVLAVMGFITAGFIAFMLITSNPFERILPLPPADGSDLNPLLQDPGLIFHPPILYMGYVGLSVAFSFAIAALASGRFDSAWARWTRPWTTIAWVFLTLGIALGSWWAYNELGWGGWWFWDPVENASLMPWLIATALMHSLAVTEKRGVFKSWTLLLAIFAFSLSLLGTFIVRSGVITSVHSFASDPEKGYLILAFLAVVIGGSLLLYVLRAPAMKSVAQFTGLSRETSLLANNVILSGIMIAVLIGTLFPVIANGFNLGVYSVGEPFFNAIFVPATVLLCLLMGVGTFTLWKRTKMKALLHKLGWPFLISGLLALLLPVVFHAFNMMASLTIFLGLWIVTTLAVDIKQKVRNASNTWVGLKRLKASYYGMVIAHVGVALTVCGAGLGTIYEDDHDVKMSLGQTRSINGYEFTLDRVNRVNGPNYVSNQAQVTIKKQGKTVDTLFPELRFYPVRQNTLKEVAIRYHVLGDLYVVFDKAVNAEGESPAWAMGFYFKPFVTWIWIGSLLMGLGGVLAILDKRYQKRVRSRADAKSEVVV